MSLTRTILLLGSVFLSCLFISSICDDAVKSLPNFSGPLPEQYSGYLVVDKANGRQLHYWFVPSRNNPTKDPVVLWMNGGPGCSSLDGFLYEHGPFKFSPEADNLTLNLNPWSWTNTASVLYLEAPAGVGFSYSNNPDDYTTNDAKTAQDNYKALKVFFLQYSQYLDNDFYISGESYAGIYVPTLAQLVLEGSKSGDNQINFRGILVGNGVTDWSFDGFLNSLVPFSYGHGLIPVEVYNQITQYCPNSPDSQECQEATAVLQNNLDDIDIYDVYSDCFHQRPSAKFFPALKGLKKIASKGKRTTKFGVNPPCVDSTKAEDYLNKPEVKQAIHVKSDIQWAICTDQINYVTNDSATMLPIYRELISNKIRVLIYSGDTDGAVPYTGSHKWTSSLGLQRNSFWREWFVKKDDGKQVAGYVTEYNGLTFATIKGAGHMVPQFKPIAGFYLFQRFLNDQPL